MLTSYKRRAFVLLSAVALQQTAASAARASDSDSLWDLLSRTSAETVSYSTPPTGTFNAQGTARQPLGPVPGFSIPAPDDGGAAAAKKAARHGLFGSLGTWFDTMEKATGSKITATGNSTFTGRIDSVSGQASAFQSEQDFGRGSNGFYNQTDLTVDATLFKYFHYTTRISNSLFTNPNDNRVEFDYKDKHTEFEWGDINAQFQGNSLIDFSRYLHGVKISHDFGPNLKTSVLYSTTKAEPRTIVIPGNDSSGPYYVYSGQIVEGSQHVRIDNSGELRLGEDYTLDPLTGQLNFLNNRIIPHTSTIAISYESLGLTQDQGTIYGGRVQYRLNQSLNLGLTYVAQTAKGASGTTLHTEEQHGLGAPQFYTSNGPIDLTKPYFVFIDGRQLGPAEYTIDNTTIYTNRIFIKDTVPFDSIVRLQYIPYDPNPTPGNRSVMGIDSTLKLGKLGTVTMETALSGLSLTGNSISGHAWQIRSDLNPTKQVHMSLAVRDINPTFSSIQSPGFGRNEKAMEFSTDYNPTSRLRLNVNYTDSLRPSYSTGGLSTTLATNGSDDYKQYGIGINYKLAKNATLSLQRNSLDTKFALGGDSTNNNDVLALTYTLERAKLNFDASLSKNDSNVSSSYALLGLTPTAATANQTLTTATSTFSKRFGIGWQPKSWLRLHGSISDNSISSSGTGLTTAGNTDAKDSSFEAQFSLIRGLRLNYSFSLSDTGNASITQPAATTTPTGTTAGSGGALNGTNVRGVPMQLLMAQMQTRDLIAGGAGTATGTTSTSTSTALTSLFGGGVNTNLGALGQFSGGLGSSTLTNFGLASYGGKSYQHSISIDYQPWTRLHLGAQFLTGSSIGDYQFNSNRNDVAFNIFWQMSNRLQFTASYGVQNLTYTGGQGTSASNSVVFALQGRPFGGKLDVQLNWSLLKTKSLFDFSNLTSPTGTTTATGTSSGTGSTPTLTNTSTNLNSLGFEVDYPLSSRQTLFVRSLLGDTSGYLGNSESNTSFGLRYGITRAMAFELGWQLQSHIYKDPSNTSLNYHASSILANLGFHF